MNRLHSVYSDKLSQIIHKPWKSKSEKNTYQKLCKSYKNCTLLCIQLMIMLPVIL